MSKLQDLINRLCPNGVPFKSLGELGIFYGGLTGKSKEDFKEGNAKFITYMNIYTNPSLKIDVQDFVKVSDSEKQNRIKKGDILYFDGDYTIEAIGLNVDEDVENNNGKKVEVIDLLDGNMISQPEDATFSYEEGIAPIEGKKFNSIKIMLGEDLMTLSEGETKNLYIKFSISQDAIKELLNSAI